VYGKSRSLPLGARIGRCQYHPRMPRLITPEHMDAPDASREELALALGYLRWVNRRLGGESALLGHLRRWSRDWPRAGEGVVTLLDLATGSADLPIAARRWALASGFDLRITGVDLHPTTLELAREHVAGVGGDIAAGITLVQADARRLTDAFKPGGFDYVHAGLFLHHLPELEVLTVLRIMDRLASRSLIWNDLVRTPLAGGAIRVLTLGQPPMVRHDAIVSVQAGFTPWTSPSGSALSARATRGTCSPTASRWCRRRIHHGGHAGARRGSRND
jgi:SAM-dependent methyltransferase